VPQARLITPRRAHRQCKKTSRDGNGGVITEGGRPAALAPLHNAFHAAMRASTFCELDGLKKLAKHYLSYSDAQIATALAQKELREIGCDDQKEG